MALGEVHHAVLALLRHDQLVSMAGQFVVMSVVVVPVFSTEDAVTDGKLQTGSRFEDERWHGQVKAKHI